MSKPSFSVSISVDERTGEVQAVYFRVREGKVFDTQEVVEGKAFADYDEGGLLLGLELLGPCEVSILDQLAIEEPARRFVRRTAPPALLVA